MSTSPGARSGSTATPPPPTRRPLWLLVLLAIVIIAALVFALVQCGSGSGDDRTDGAPASAVPSAAPAPGASPSDGDADDPADSSASAAPQAGAGEGALTAGGTALLPLAQAAGSGGQLSALVGQPVTAQGVAVESVPSDEGFWVGTGATDRVWVQLTVPPGESPFQVQPGQRLDFTGTGIAHDAGFAQQVGVDAAEGADQLTGQAAHVEVAKADLRVR